MTGGAIAHDVPVRRVAAPFEAEIGDELLALHVESGICFGMNGSAARIWRLLKQPRTAGELFAVIERVYDVDPGICALETSATLRELEQDGLIALG